MNRNIIGHRIGAFGTGVVTSGIILYPLGYLESESVFRILTFTGISLIALGIFARSFKKVVNKKMD